MWLEVKGRSGFCCKPQVITSPWSVATSHASSAVLPFGLSAGLSMVIQKPAPALRKAPARQSAALGVSNLLLDILLPSWYWTAALPVLRRSHCGSPCFCLQAKGKRKKKLMHFPRGQGDGREKKSVKGKGGSKGRIKSSVVRLRWLCIEAFAAASLSSSSG